VLRERSAQVRAVAEQLRARHPGQPLLSVLLLARQPASAHAAVPEKLPAELVDLLPQLTAAADASLNVLEPPPAASQAAETVGQAYRDAAVSSVAAREPFTVDPGLVERGLKGHADTQNELARVLRSAGIEPRSHRPQEPNFDLAWTADGTVFVAEIKSITDANEEGQLRLGLGQVLRYRYQLEKLGHHHVLAVLVPEREPRDPTWRDLCNKAGVIMLNGGELDRAPELGQDRE
jgi:hypothetical protein